MLDSIIDSKKKPFVAVLNRYSRIKFLEFQALLV